MRFALFRSRSVSGANLVMFLVGAAFFSMWYFLSLYLQNVLGFSALKTGLAFLPMGVTAAALNAGYSSAFVVAAGLSIAAALAAFIVPAIRGRANVSR